MKIDYISMIIIEVKENDDSVDIYVSAKYAKEIKQFVDELRMKEEK